jgi:hypothetical protein
VRTYAILRPASVKARIAAALRLLESGATTADNLKRRLQCSPKELVEVLNRLEKTHCLEMHGHLVSLGRPKFGRLPLSFNAAGGEYVFGLVADTHLCCREERLDALHAVYDRFAQLKIKHVLHAGNIVDGYVPRINGASVIVSGIDDQCAYVTDNYPQRAGMFTYFITGDDHEGWWMKEGFNFGAYLESVAQRSGRKDLHYIGHVESDVTVKTSRGDVIIKVQHPGGGSSYARSYAGQKQVEALTGGEKPHILVQGHYHVSNYMIERNIHVISLPGFQDQTIFARKKRLRMEVGGAVLRFTVTDAGAIGRLQLEFLPFFDRAFYRAFLRSDARIKAGRLVISQ